MRIGIFTDTYSPIISGVVTAVTILEKELRAKGHEVFIFTLENEDAKDDNDNVIRFTGIKVPLEDLDSYRLGFFLRRKLPIIKKYDLDIIHLHTEFTMARLARLASVRYKIPLVYTFHTLYEDYLQYISKTIDKLFHKKFLSSLASILIKPINKISIIKTVPTRKVLSKISNYYLSGDIRVVPTGIDIKALSDKKISENELTKLKMDLKINGKFVFLYIGRIAEEKSIDVLVKAYARIKSEKTVFVIVGDGPNLSGLKELAVNLGMTTEDIKFLGFIEWKKIVPYYQLGDVFLNASVTETQGLTYIEALACGIPLLVKKDECLEDVLIDGINGYGYNDINELVDYMNKFVAEPLLVRKLKENMSESIGKFSKEEFVKAIEKIYLEAIKNKYKNKRTFFTKR